MRGNIVTAAAVFGLAMVLSSAVLILGARWVLNGAVDRLGPTIQEHGRSIERAGDRAGAPIQGALKELTSSVERHAQSVERAGDRAGVPIQAALKELTTGVERHGQAVERAGDKVSHPQFPAEYNVKLQGPVAVQQPLTIRGAAQDGSLPVNAKIGK